MPMSRLRQRNEWKFFGVLPKADRGLAAAWWLVLVLRGVLPAVFAVAMGVLVGAVQAGDGLGRALALVGVVFVLLQVLTPIHQAVSANLGDRTAAWLYDRLTEACVRPPGMGHLEDPKLTNDLTVARDFDLGMTGPPLSISMDFIAGGLVEMIGGLASAVVLAATPGGRRSCSAARGWRRTGCCARARVWRDRNTDEVRGAQRDADYAYRLAVDPPASKELRLFGLAGWTIDRFVARRTRLHELQYEATRLRERPVAVEPAARRRRQRHRVLVARHTPPRRQPHSRRGRDVRPGAVGTSMIAFGGLNWALDGAAAPVAAVLRLEPAMAPAGALPPASAPPPAAPAREIRFRDLTFAYPGGAPVLEGFDLTIPAGSSLAIVGQNGAGKTTLAKLLCRLYDPQAGAIEVDGVDLREFDLGVVAVAR